jgi:hypothetical protein
MESQQNRLLMRLATSLGGLDDVLTAADLQRPCTLAATALGLSRSPRQIHESPANGRSLSLQTAAKSAYSSKLRPLRCG